MTRACASMSSSRNRRSSDAFPRALKARGPGNAPSPRRRGSRAALRRPFSCADGPIASASNRIITPNPFVLSLSKHRFSFWTSQEKKDGPSTSSARTEGFGFCAIQSGYALSAILGRNGFPRVGRGKYCGIGPSRVRFRLPSQMDLSEAAIVQLEQEVIPLPLPPPRCRNSAPTKERMSERHLSM